jgi:hypothetical protein
MEQIKKIGVIIVLSVILLGCVPSGARSIVRDKHAQSYVLDSRIRDNDPSNDPTVQEMKTFITCTAKDWESMDKLINNWKPDQAGVMKPISLEDKK